MTGRDPPRRVQLDDGYRIGAALNGGYLLRVVGEVLADVVPEASDPLAVSAYYASAGLPGDAEVATRVVRRGGSSAVLGAELAQEGEVRLSVLATYGDLGAETGPSAAVATTASPPDLPPVEQCVAPADMAPEFARQAPFVQQVEMRSDPASAGWLAGRPSGRGLQQAWFRPEGGRDATALDLLMVLDALPPVTYDLGRPGWAPTLELTAHVRARPAPGWLAVVHATRNLAGGLFEEDSEVWDSTGRLVAQGRQLARLPRA